MGAIAYANKGIDEDSPQAHSQVSADPGSGCPKLRAPAEAVVEFPSEPTGEQRSETNS